MPTDESSGGVTTTSEGLPTTVEGVPTTVEGTTFGSTSHPMDTSTTDVPTTGEPAFCGDGNVDLGEACDDGLNNGPGQACTALCELAACGDGVLDSGEACDDGANNGGYPSRELRRDMNGAEGLPGPRCRTTTRT